MLGILVFASLLGCIPGAIAQKKGHSFIKWWIFGSALFFVALPVSLMIEDRTRLSLSFAPYFPAQGRTKAGETMTVVASLAFAAFIAMLIAGGYLSNASVPDVPDITPAERAQQDRVSEERRREIAAQRKKDSDIKVAQMVPSKSLPKAHPPHAAFRRFSDAAQQTRASE
jgi:ABC-type dipeptide/oligopeptide/nickel transport system permease component